MRYSLLILFLITIVSCSEEEGNVQPSSPGNSEWLIPIDEVRDGGVGRDGIPSIDNPTFSLASEQEVLFDHELVTGILVNGVPIAYPHKVLDYHEIVNHNFEGYAYSLSFCPLTGTSIVFPGKFESTSTEYGVSGLLFNSNLILYDRSSESYWSQMMLQSVRGVHKEKKVDFFQVIETTWATWKNWFPQSLVLDPPNGKPRSYDIYAYGGYRENHDLLLFQPKNDFTGYPRKERLLGVIIKDRMAHFRFNQFQNGVTLYQDIAIGEKLLVFGNPDDNYLFAFSNETTNGEEVIVQSQFENQSGGRLFQDETGSVWDVFGRAIEGPRIGQQLKTFPNYIGYSFAMAAFYPDDFLDKSEF